MPAVCAIFFPLSSFRCVCHKLSFRDPSSPSRSWRFGGHGVFPLQDCTLSRSACSRRRRWRRRGVSSIEQLRWETALADHEGRRPGTGLFLGCNLPRRAAPPPFLLAPPCPSSAPLLQPVQLLGLAQIATPCRAAPCADHQYPHDYRLNRKLQGMLGTHCVYPGYLTQLPCPPRGEML